MIYTEKCTTTNLEKGWSRVVEFDNNSHLNHLIYFPVFDSQITEQSSHLNLAFEVPHREFTD